MDDMSFIKALFEHIKKQRTPKLPQNTIPVFEKFRKELERTNSHEIMSDTFPQLSEQDQVSLISKYLKEFDMLPFKSTDEPENPKSATVSAELRKAGNNAYLNEDNRAAIALYTKSIAAAPYPALDGDTSEELALSYGNRSAVYFRLGKYETCLKDIGRALDFQYPLRLKYKLFERRAKCYHRLGRLQDAQASSQDAITHARTSNLTGKWMLEFLVAMQTLHLQDGGACVQDGRSTTKRLPRKSHGQHKFIKSASACVDIFYDPEKGRHFVANRDIDPGDILFVEKPYASVLFSDSRLSHCYNCMKRHDALVPCKTCHRAMYCSDECRSSSWDKTHKVECRVNRALSQVDGTSRGGVSENQLALPLRLLLNACNQNGGILGLYNLAKTLDERNTAADEGIKGFNQKGQYDPSDYATVHHLIHHNHQQPRLSLIGFGLGAACTFNCLEAYSDFFSCASLANENKETIAAVKLFVAGLLLKLLGIVSTNSFYFTDFVTNVKLREAEDVDFGYAVYPTLSLLNHSCDPNASSSFHQGDVHVIMARQPIRKGDEVCITYTHAYADQDVNTRKKELLRKYSFHCKCIACSSNWPVYNYLESMYSPTFLCRDCHSPLKGMKLRENLKNTSVICMKCKKKYDLMSLMNRHEEILLKLSAIFNQMKTGSLVDFTPELAGIVKTVDSFVQSPSQLTFNSQQHLRSSMKTTGNHVIIQ